jgi:hypothetical protein
MTSRCCWSRRLSEAPAARTSSSSSANVFSLLFCQKTCRKSRAGKKQHLHFVFLFQRVSSGVIFHASSFFIDNRLKTFLLLLQKFNAKCFVRNFSSSSSSTVGQNLLLNISSYSLIPLDITGCLL